MGRYSQATKPQPQNQLGKGDEVFAPSFPNFGVHSLMSQTFTLPQTDMEAPTRHLYLEPGLPRGPGRFPVNLEKGSFSFFTFLVDGLPFRFRSWVAYL